MSRVLKISIKMYTVLMIIANLKTLSSVTFATETHNRIYDR